MTYNNERVESFETVSMRKDGTRIHVSLTISPVHDAEGLPMTYLSPDTDFTTQADRRPSVRPNTDAKRFRREGL